MPNEPVGDLALRRDALRQAAAMPRSDARALLDAVLTELDGAIDALATAPGQPDGPAAEGAADVVRAERHLLHVAFQRAPVPLLLLELDGTIRRASASAADLLGAPTGYATGKPLSVFVDPPSRAALQTQLAAVARTGQARQARCRMLTPGGTAEVLLAADRVEVPGEPSLLEVALAAEPLVTGPAPGDAAEGAVPGRTRRAAGTPRADAPQRAIQAMARRMDMVTAVTRLLLDNSTFSEAVTLQRCARLLAGEVATWVIVDMERGGQLHRQFAIGPRGGLAREVRDADPQPGTVPSQVHAARKPVLLAHADAGTLGTGTNGASLLLSLGATSLISVPIADKATSYGALTLLRLAGEDPFDIADLALAEVLGEHLGIAIRVDRMFRRRSEVAEALQASLLPASLPKNVPGLEFAAGYIPATNWPEISGDFYDVFRHGDGWAVALGDVCGKGQDAAAMTAAARHAIRALVHHDAGRSAGEDKDPADVLAAASDVLLAGDYDERFVTAKLAFLNWRDQRLHVLLGSSGHPGPAVVRADGRVEILEGDGLPLGLFPDAEPSRGELDLDDGDLLFFYSDGVTDARSARRGFLEDRLADELAGVAGRSAIAVVRAVTDLVTEYSRGDLRDDVTILAIKVSAPSV